MLFCCVAGVLRTEETDPIHGETQLSSQSSGPRLNSSGETLLTWENLSREFRLELNGLQTNLLMAYKEAEQSTLSLTKWTDLYDNSLLRITNLERYNSQIAERMQERDMDLAAAYDTIDKQKKDLLRKDNTILKMGIAIGLLVLVIIAGIAIKIYHRRPLPF